MTQTTQGSDPNSTPYQPPQAPAPQAPGLLQRVGGGIERAARGYRSYRKERAEQKRLALAAPPTKEQEDHFEEIRAEIQQFDEERKNALERALHGIFLLCAYVAPFVIALAIGSEIADKYSGAWRWGDSWSVATHLVAWAGEIALAMLTLSIATAIRRYAADKEYLARLIASACFFVLFSLASGLAQWYVATAHIHADTSHMNPGLAALIFRVAMVPAIDLASMLYLSIMKIKSLRRYLAEQAQKADAIELVNKSHLRVEQAQQDALQTKRQHDQYIESLRATQQLVIDLQQVITSKILAEARGETPANDGPANFRTIAASNGNGRAKSAKV